MIRKLTCLMALALSLVLAMPAMGQRVSKSAPFVSGPTQISVNDLAKPGKKGVPLRQPSTSRSGFAPGFGPLTLASDPATSLNTLGTPVNAPRRAAAEPSVRGCLYWIWDEPGITPLSGNGIYEIAPQGDPSMLFQNDYLRPNYGGVLVEDYYYAFCADEDAGGGWIYVFDTANGWNCVNSYYDRDVAYMASDLTYDEMTGNIYGCFMMSDGDGDFTGKYCLATIEISLSAGPELTVIKEQIPSLTAIACDGDGQLYGIVMRTGMLVKINKSTGDYTEIAATGLTESTSSSAAFDLETGVLYMAPASGGVFTIDTDTGEATRYAETSWRMTGIYVESATETPEPPVTPDLSKLFAGKYWIYDEDPLSGNYVYNLPTDGSAPIQVAQRDNFHPNYGGVIYDGFYYSFCSDEEGGGMWIHVFDIADDWTEVKEFKLDDLSYLPTCVTYDDMTGNVYGCFNVGDGDGGTTGRYRLCTISLSPKVEPTLNVIGDLPQMFTAIACDSNGRLYGFKTQGTGSFGLIDKATAEYTEIGNTGLRQSWISSACFDTENDVLYYAPASGGLYTVDVANGTLTQINSDMTYVGLVVNNETTTPEPPAPEIYNPGPVSNVATHFEGTSLSGSITFDAPEVDKDGNPATGALTYKILANGEPCAEGSTEFGVKNVTADVTMAAAGTYNFRVTVATEAGESKAVAVKVYVGNDMPLPVENVQLVLANNVLTCSWDAVTGVVNGGYFDPSLVTYHAELYCNGEKVEAATYDGTATTCSYTVAAATEFTRYEYRVAATFVDATSQAVASNTAVDGCIVPPMYEPFDLSLGDFTAIDCNHDGVTWDWYNAWGSAVARIIASETKPKDDWLMSPPIYLEAGKYYEFDCDIFKPEPPVWSGEEILKVCYGTSATPEGMTNELKPLTTLSSDDFDASIHTGIVPTESGIYYFGIYTCSKPDQNVIYVDNFSISAPAAIVAPAAVTDLVVTPDANGGLSAEITFTAPSTTIGGDPLNVLNKIEIYRNDELIHTVEPATVGQSVTYTDNAPDSGLYTYMVKSYNASGASPEVKVEEFVGINLPVAPEESHWVESSEGMADVMWAPVDVDINGRALSFDKVSYSVMYGTQTIASGIQDNQLQNVKVVEEGQRSFAQFAVYASTDYGMSTSPAYTQFGPIGAPYRMPFVADLNPDESGNLPQAWGADQTNIIGVIYCQIGILQTQEMGGIDYDANGTDNFWVINGNAPGYSATLYSSKISVDDQAQNPALVYYVFGIASNDENLLDVYINGELASSTVMGTYPQGEWTRVVLDLSAYRGQDIFFAIKGKIMTHSYIIFDGLDVIDVPCHDLTAYIDAPATIVADKEAQINVRVNNVGLDYFQGYEVNLYRNDELVATNAVDALISGGECQTVVFDELLTVVDPVELNYYAEVVGYDDEVEANNVSSVVTSILSLPSYPVVELEGTVNDLGQAELSWTAPDLTGTPTLPITDDFESYVAWVPGDKGNWTFLDLDEAPMGSALGVDFPGYTPGLSSASFVLVDNTELNESWLTTSGVKLMASMYNSDGSANDDWMISPALSGSAQTISFFAKSYSAAYPETFEVLYTTGAANDPAGYELLYSETEAPAQWTRYNVAIPAGATHFAIRCTSQDRFMLFVDDVAFIPAVSPWTDLVVNGFNIYRDGAYYADADAAALAYTDGLSIDGDHSYLVTVNYSVGQSAPSNIVTLSTTGVTSAMVGNVNIAVEGRTIVVTGLTAGNVSIFTIDGKAVYTSDATGRNVATVAPGVYVVKAATSIAKVIVR